ncbi:MAG: hypothetical protein Q4P23_14135, partial [Micrococcaceae bacterium]|nr:hypothetical protein [Micrococcaceae bacterium]
IEAMAARIALQTPGVLRLEPTIQDLIGRVAALGGAGTGRGRNRRHDGVVATIIDGMVRVRLDVATDITHTALQVAHAVQERVFEGVRATGLIPGTVDVSILAIEPANVTV